MKAWWQNLNRREQMLVVLMSTLVVIFLFYSLIWQPLAEKTQTAQSKIARQQELLTWVKQQTTLVKKNSGSTAARSEGSLSSVVSRSVAKERINIARMQPQGEELIVWIDEVPFRQLLSWLEQLSTDYGLVVKAIDIGNSDKAGVVRIRRLQLARG